MYRDEKSTKSKEKLDSLVGIANLNGYHSSSFHFSWRYSSLQNKI